MKKQRSKFSLIITTVTLMLSAQALAADTTISASTLAGYDVAGVKLGMTLDEAKAALAAKGYDGGKMEYRTDSNGAAMVNDGKGEFHGLDGMVTLLTYKDAAKAERVWGVEYFEQFKSKQDTTIWLDRIKKRYGSDFTRLDEESDNRGGYDIQRLIYSLTPLPPSKYSMLLIDNFIESEGAFTSEGRKAKEERRELTTKLEQYSDPFHYETLDIQGLAATSRPESIEIRLKDGGLIRAEKERLEKAKADQVKKDSNETSVNF